MPRPCLVPVCLPYNPSRKSLGRSGLVRRYGVVLLLVYSGINSKANIYRTLAKRPRALSVGVCGTGAAPEARWLRWLTERKARAEAYEYRTMRPLGRPWTVEHVLLFIYNPLCVARRQSPHTRGPGVRALFAVRLCSAA